MEDDQGEFTRRMLRRAGLKKDKEDVTNLHSLRRRLNILRAIDFNKSQTEQATDEESEKSKENISRKEKKPKKNVIKKNEFVTTSTWSKIPSSFLESMQAPKNPESDGNLSIDEFFHKEQFLQQKKGNSYKPEKSLKFEKPSLPTKSDSKAVNYKNIPSNKEDFENTAVWEETAKKCINTFFENMSSKGKSLDNDQVEKTTFLSTASEFASPRTNFSKSEFFSPRIESDSSKNEFGFSRRTFFSPDTQYFTPETDFNSLKKDENISAVDLQLREEYLTPQNDESFAKNDPSFTEEEAKFKKDFPFRKPDINLVRVLDTTFAKDQKSTTGNTTLEDSISELSLSTFVNRLQEKEDNSTEKEEDSTKREEDPEEEWEDATKFFENSQPELLKVAYKMTPIEKIGPDFKIVLSNREIRTSSLPAPESALKKVERLSDSEFETGSMFSLTSAINQLDEEIENLEIRPAARVLEKMIETPKKLFQVKSLKLPSSFTPRNLFRKDNLHSENRIDSIESVKSGSKMNESIKSNNKELSKARRDSVQLKMNESNKSSGSKKNESSSSRKNESNSSKKSDSKSKKKELNSWKKSELKSKNKKLINFWMNEPNNSQLESVKSKLNESINLKINESVASKLNDSMDSTMNESSEKRRETIIFKINNNEVVKPNNSEPNNNETVKSNNSETFKPNSETFKSNTETFKSNTETFKSNSETFKSNNETLKSNNNESIKSNNESVEMRKKQNEDFNNCSTVKRTSGIFGFMTPKAWRSPKPNLESTRKASNIDVTKNTGSPQMESPISSINPNSPSNPEEVKQSPRFSEASLPFEVEQFLEDALGEELYNTSITYGFDNTKDRTNSNLDASDLISERSSIHWTTNSPKKEPQRFSRNSTLNKTITVYKTLSRRIKKKFRPSLNEAVKHVWNPVLPATGNLSEKLQPLVQEVNIQQTLTYQASKALDYCRSMKEFHASPEHVESDRLLLVAGLKKQTLFQEIKSLCAGPKEEKLYSEQASISVEKLGLTLKDDFFTQKRKENCTEVVEWFVVVVSQGLTVWATQAIPCFIDSNPKIWFPGSLEIPNLNPDFKILVRVFRAKFQSAIYNHAEKFHIQERDRNMSCPSPTKFLKRVERSSSVRNHEVKFSGIRETSFTLVGALELRVHDLSQFTPWPLMNVPGDSILDPTIDLCLTCKLDLTITHCGFLNYGDEMGGFAVWNRLWCNLQQHMLMFWNYPREQGVRSPLFTIDLMDCVSGQVNTINRSLCARPRTFLVEIARERNERDRDSGVMECRPGCTIVKHLLQCDTLQDLMEWKAKLNHILAAFQEWNVKGHVPVESSYV